jgi:hypothetical protein
MATSNGTKPYEDYEAVDNHVAITELSPPSNPVVVNPPGFQDELTTVVIGIVGLMLYYGARRLWTARGRSTHR